VELAVVEMVEQVVLQERLEQQTQAVVVVVVVEALLNSPAAQAAQA
jgi:hypothetical protein